jgi:glyoxylase-like metal-dependent hydrolase (beta-lactamase superfamily II)
MTDFNKGLQELGNGIFAYLQPDGSWGWSNAGLIKDGEESLLVDTLFDADLTQDMLDCMRDAAGVKQGDIGTLVNTHANGDHCHGNHLVHNADIIASAAAAAEMAEITPELMAELVKMAPQMGDMGEYFLHCFGQFKFDGIVHTPPTCTFSGEKTLSVGDKKVDLIEVGPAHTRGDVLVYVPADRTVFTGDILFIDGTPIMWAGPVQNWIDACNKIIAMDVQHIVPGHGPVTDKQGVARVRDYLAYLDREARQRFDAGMPVAEAAFDIALGEYRHWLDSERVMVNVHTLYREYRNDSEAADVMELFTLMAQHWKQYGA